MYATTIPTSSDCIVHVVAKVMFEGVILIHCKGKMVFYLDRMVQHSRFLVTRLCVCVCVKCAYMNTHNASQALN